MKKALGIVLASLMLLIAAGCGASAGSVPESGASASNSVPSASEDSSAAQEQEPRIISTTVAATEMMDALGIDLVGIPTSSKQLPARYEGVTEVGNPMSPDMEIVKSLKPTEVYSVTTLQYDLESVFDSAGVDATFLDLTSLEDMMNAIGSLGEHYGKEKEAEELVSSYQDKLAEIQEAIQGKPKPKVLILLGVPGSYLVATENSYIGDLVRLAGGENIVQGESVEYLASNTEYLQQSNPDVILRAAHGMPEEVIEMFDKDFKENDIWKHFNAVQNGRVYDLEEKLFGTTGNLYAMEALDELMGMLYPS